MISKPLVSILAASLVSQAATFELPEFMKTDEYINATPEEQAQQILNQMNFTEKYSMTRGRGSSTSSGNFVGHTMALPRVGIP